MAKRANVYVKENVDFPNPLQVGVDFKDPRASLKDRRRKLDPKFPVAKCRRKADRRKVHNFDGDWWLKRRY